MFDKEKNNGRLRDCRKCRQILVESIRKFDLVDGQKIYARQHIMLSLLRGIDLFDDGIVLLDNGRLTSAIIIARSFFEQVGHTARIVQILSENKNDEIKTEKLLRDLNNSSELRSRIFKGEIDPNLIYTNEAKEKFGKKTPVTETKKFIEALQLSLTSFGDTENKARLMYSALSEYSHPTFFSLATVYIKNRPPVLTSFGLLSPDEVMRSYTIYSFSLMALLAHIWTFSLD